MKRKGQPGKAEGEELCLQGAALSRQSGLYQEVVKGLGHFFLVAEMSRTIPNTVSLTVT